MARILSHPFRQTKHADPFFDSVVQSVLGSKKINPKKLAAQWKQTKSGWFSAIKEHLLSVDFSEQVNAENSGTIVLPPFTTPQDSPRESNVADEITTPLSKLGIDDDSSNMEVVHERTDDANSTSESGRFTDLNNNNEGVRDPERKK